jgi:ABC-2 type transport system permease protein
VNLSVADSDKTQASRRLVDTFSSSNYFRVTNVPAASYALGDVMAERSRACLIIPPRFEKDLLNGRSAEVQLLLDGADNSTVGPVAGYMGAIQSMANQKIADFSPQPPFQLRTRYLFNQELNSQWFTIPGLTVVVMAIMSILLTALTVAREWENGSMELLLSTPVRPTEIIIGKLAPYAVLGMTAVTFVFVVAVTVFSVPFEGNILVFGLGAGLFLGTYLAQGLLISVTTKKQQIAMQFTMLTGLLPANLLSGFVFPVESMPTFSRYFTMILPARWFMKISRDTFLKGSGLVELGDAFTVLAILCCLMIFLATRKFKRDLE